MPTVDAELRDILASIRLCAQMSLRKRDLPPGAKKKLLETIAEECQRGLHLIQPTLDLSHKAVLQTNLLNLVALVQDLLPCLRGALPQSIRLTTAMTSRPCPVEADAARICQVLIDLIINARDALPQGGEMRIAVDRVATEPREGSPPLDVAPGLWARLTVSDTGPATRPAVREQLSLEAVESAEGMHLGLIQAYDTVKRHGGFIDVERRGAEGTTFAIYLPLVEGKDSD